MTATLQLALMFALIAVGCSAVEPDFSSDPCWPEENAPVWLKYKCWRDTKCAEGLIGGLENLCGQNKVGSFTWDPKSDKEGSYAGK